MAIKSEAFGRVTLSGPDAETFARQVTYGRPSKLAKEIAVRGVELSKEVRQTGSVTIKVKTL